MTLKKSIIILINLLNSFEIILRTQATFLFFFQTLKHLLSTLREHFKLPSLFNTSSNIISYNSHLKQLNHKYPLYKTTKYKDRMQYFFSILLTSSIHFIFAN